MLPNTGNILGKIEIFHKDLPLPMSFLTVIVLIHTVAVDDKLQIDGLCINHEIVLILVVFFILILPFMCSILWVLCLYWKQRIAYVMKVP